MRRATGAASESDIAEKSCVLDQRPLGKRRRIWILTTTSTVALLHLKGLPVHLLLPKISKALFLQNMPSL